MSIRRAYNTKEEKVASKIADLLSDLRVDLDQVGMYLARIKPNVNFNRLMVVIDSAEAEKSKEYDRKHIYPLFD